MGKTTEKSWNFHTCKLCSYRSKSKFLMYKHGKFHRRKLKNEDFICHSNTPEMFECEFCGFDTSIKVDLSEHLSVFHEERKVNEEMVDILKRLRCANCDFETHSLLVLTKHSDDCHIGGSLQQETNLDKTPDNLHVLSMAKHRNPVEMTGPSSSDNEPLPKEILNKKAIIVLTRVNPAPTKVKKNYSPKKSYCLYCKELRTKIARHFETVHSNKVEVQEFMHLPKGSNERKKVIEKLRLLGNFEYNNSEDCQQMITCRRLPVQNYKKYFLPCSNCKGYYSKSSLRQHFGRCSNEGGRKKNITLTGRRLQYSFLEKACQRLKVDILPAIRSEQIAETIINDPLLILYGNSLCTKYESSSRGDNCIKTTLARLGKFYAEMKGMYSRTTLSRDIFDPFYFKGICNAVDKLGKRDPKTGVYKTPTTALNLVLCFRQYAHFYIIDCVRNKNFEERRKTEALLELVPEMLADIDKTIKEKKILCR